MFKVTFTSALLVIAIGISVQTRGNDAGSAELARIQSEYSDVLALQGIAKAEVLVTFFAMRRKVSGRNGKTISYPNRIKL
jgi:hypothetical protein